MSKKTKKINDRNILNVGTFAVAVISVCLLFVRMYRYISYSSSNKKSISTNIQGIIPVSTPSPTDIPTVYPTLTEPKISTFAIPRQQIDLTEWKMFEYSAMGVRFKYPGYWGSPVVKYEKGEIGYLFSVRFPNSSFVVGGTSSDYTAGRGGHYTDFNGFGNKFWWKSSDKICNAEIIYCQTTQSSAQILVGYVQEGPSLFGPYERLYFVNRDGKTISGLVFGGGFLSAELQKYISPFYEPHYITERKQFDEAVLSRKLDVTSMKRFDEIEKVFETIELW